MPFPGLPPPLFRYYPGYPPGFVTYPPVYQYPWLPGPSLPRKAPVSPDLPRKQQGIVSDLTRGNPRTVL
jgi:hypothetical protein